MSIYRQGQAARIHPTSIILYTVLHYVGLDKCRDVGASKAEFGARDSKYVEYKDEESSVVLA
jgi:hypothetical protein